MPRIRDALTWVLAAGIVAAVVYTLLWLAFVGPLYLKLYISGG